MIGLNHGVPCSEMCFVSLVFKICLWRGMKSNETGRVNSQLEEDFWINPVRNQLLTAETNALKWILHT